MNNNKVHKVTNGIKGKITVSKIIVASLFYSGGTISEKQAKQYLKEQSRLSGSK